MIGLTPDITEASVVRQDPLEHRAAAERLARDAYRLAPSPPEHVARVLPHRIEVDERERCLDAGEYLLVALVLAHALEAPPLVAGDTNATARFARGWYSSAAFAAEIA